MLAQFKVHIACAVSILALAGAFIIWIMTPAPSYPIVVLGNEPEFIQCSQRNGNFPYPTFYQIGNKTYNQCDLMGRRI